MRYRPDFGQSTGSGDCLLERAGFKSEFAGASQVSERQAINLLIFNYNPQLKP